MSTPRPFSPLLYFRRHKRQTFALLAALILSLMVIAFVGGIVTSIQENVRLSRSYLRQVSLVSPLTPEGLSGERLALIERHPDVTRAYPVGRASTQIPLLVGDTPFRIFLLTPDDIGDLAQRLSLRLQDGRWPERAGEIVISAQAARAKGWRLDQEVGSDVTERESLRGRYRVVGLIAGDSWFGLAALGAGTDLPDRLLVPEAGRHAALNRWLQEQVAVPKQVQVQTLEETEAQLRRDLGSLTVLLTLMTAMVTLTGTVVTGLLLYIFVLQRRSELALYLALGHRLRTVLRRLLTETFTILMCGWLCGTLLTLALFWWLRQVFFDPRGLALQVINPTVLLHTLIGPVVTTLVMAIPIARMLTRFDYISTIEGRE